MKETELIVLYLRILEDGEVKKGGRNAAIIRELDGIGWLLPTGLKDRYKISDQKRDSIEQRLDNRHSGWRELRNALRAHRLPMTMDGLKELESRRKLDGAVLPAMAHRKTVSAALGLHSKTGTSRTLRELAGRAILTTDQVLRIRTNRGLILRTKEGREVSCDSQMSAFGEVLIPQRSFVSGVGVGGTMPKVVFTIENLGSYMDFPDISPEALAIHAPGNDTVLTEEFLRLLPDSCPHLHFGDLDPKGLEIAGRLSRRGRQPMRFFIPSFWAEYIETPLALDMEWPREKGYGEEDPIVQKLKLSGKRLEQEGIAFDPRLERAIQDVIDEAIVFAG